MKLRPSYPNAPSQASVISTLTMFLTSPLLNLSSLKPHPSPFVNAASSISQNALLPKPPTLSSTSAFPPSTLLIQAMKKLQGRVVKNANDKTVAVEVVRLAPHPKYKRRVRIKKRYQAHDPENKFNVGDYVQLEKIRPISKTKTFLAIPVIARNAPKAPEAVPAELREMPTQTEAV
ncbi:uncharacterized protein A4U43_C09F7460 [Asparagus officinalis]|uniref:Small ribosomal subunit protein uS17c n=1 Tax=Asparagus officinalis TaxID=4686 RepID=A0A5P1E6E9_ASPOF|nr:30S ribosomal protein S17, chloroplastic [Asparagus officinalis]ONK58039.1 uncharacterized protein A4U43_C09F7460 [Asparagus officinalis]